MDREVMPRRGELHIRDARAVLGNRFFEARSLDVLVLDSGGVCPVGATVFFLDRPGGRGNHRVFQCGGCGVGSLILYARKGKLLCRRCHRVRTRRQAQRTRADWRRRGELQTDQLLRLFALGRTAARLEHVRQLGEEIIAADIGRLCEMKAQLADLQLVMQI